MEKLFTQTIDLNINDYKTKKDLGAVVIHENDYTIIELNNPYAVPNWIKQHLENNVAKINDNGYIMIPNELWKNVTYFDYDVSW